MYFSTQQKWLSVTEVICISEWCNRGSHSLEITTGGGFVLSVVWAEAAAADQQLLHKVKDPAQPW